MHTRSTLVLSTVHEWLLSKIVLKLRTLFLFLRHTPGREYKRELLLTPPRWLMRNFIVSIRPPVCLDLSKARSLDGGKPPPPPSTSFQAFCWWGAGMPTTTRRPADSSIQQQSSTRHHTDFPHRFVSSVLPVILCIQEELQIKPATLFQIWKVSKKKTNNLWTWCFLTLLVLLHYMYYVRDYLTIWTPSYLLMFLY